MSNMRELNVQLNDWEIRYVLESLSKEMQRLKKINYESECEDEAADAGNDYIELSGFYERVSQSAVGVFGDQILNFDRETL